MKTIILISIAALALASCTAPITPGSTNPLDTPGPPVTAAEIRAAHITAITGIPTAP